MYALIVLQERMLHPRFDRDLLLRATEGYAAPGKTGWTIQNGSITVAGHKFGLSGLFDELDSLRVGLFA